jgi:hypothetical protein
MCFRVNKIPGLHPHFQGHDAFTALVDETRALKTKGPLYYMSEDSSPIGFIMGLDPNDNPNPYGSWRCMVLQDKVEVWSCRMGI